MKKIQAQLILGVIAELYLLYEWVSKSGVKEYETIAEGIIIPLIISGIIDVMENIDVIKIYILSKTIYVNWKVRFSVAYLFVIKIDNQYLLIKNQHKGHFQLVGGAYKSFPEANVIFQELNVKPDEASGTDSIRE